ncbi:MAG: DUF3667 domain-containing protein [Bacteroidota bacterium]|nr:DUF3667 domain-containing protein [Bacteroidota bacterium]
MGAKANLPDIGNDTSVTVFPPDERKNFTLCHSCGYTVHKTYCPNCGEKRLDRRDFKLKHYLEESFEGITHFDNKFFRTVRLLITKPGRLSAYYFEGKRVAYMRPFQLFIVCNILFFLLVGNANVFSLPLSTFYDQSPYTDFNSRELIRPVAHTDAQFRTAAASFNEKMGNESKEFLALFIGSFTLICWLGFHRRERYLSEHLVFSTHFLSFILLYYTVFTLLISATYYHFFSTDYNSTFDAIYSLFSLSVFGSYFAIAARRFYKAKTLRSIIGAVLITAIFLVTLYSYRMLLLYKIIHEVYVSR